MNSIATTTTPRAWAIPTAVALFLLLAAGQPSRADHPDGLITIKAKTALAISERVDADDIDVETDDGVVTLEGTVDSEAERQAALSLVSDIEGVEGIRDELRLEEKRIVLRSTTATTAGEGVAVAPPSDSDREFGVGEQALIERVNEALAREEGLRGTDVWAVSAAGRVVLLSGTAESLDQELEAVRVAQSVQGVDGVMSEVVTEDVGVR